MVLPLSFLLLIFLAYDLDQPCAATFFFSCIAVLVRDIVGQQLERVKKEIKFSRKQKPTKTNTPTKPHQPNKTPPTKTRPGKDPGKFANKVKQVKRPRPSQAPHKFSSAK